MNNPAFNRNPQAGMSEQEAQTMAAVKAVSSSSLVLWLTDGT